MVLFFVSRPRARSLLVFAAARWFLLYRLNDSAEKVTIKMHRSTIERDKVFHILGD